MGDLDGLDSPTTLGTKCFSTWAFRCSCITVAVLSLLEVDLLLFRRFRAGLIVALGAILVVGTQGVSPAQADTNAPLPLVVNFQAQTTVTPAGYIGDYGQAYDPNLGYGWTDGSGNPTSSVGRGRERGVYTADCSTDPTVLSKCLDTFIHMQPSVGGVGAWKAAVANGTYKVTVAVGDASVSPVYTDSHHVIRVEGTKIIDLFPSATTKHATQTTTVTVTDGFINIDAQTGSNTKIDYLKIESAPATPQVISILPANGSTGVSRNQSLTAQLSEPVDATTLDAGVKLLGPSGQEVVGNRNTDGVNSNATFVPASTLSPNTTYTFQINANLKTLANGAAYAPFTSTFTTGADGDATVPVNFTRQTFSLLSGATVMTFGPDGALYVGTLNGSIFKYIVGANGLPVGNPTEIVAYKNLSTISGLAFDPTSTPSNLKLWVSRPEKCPINCANWTGKISVLTGANLSTSRDVVVGLPRSVKDHMNNGIDFGPDGKLYLAQGSQTGFGYPDLTWGNIPENPLNATVLQMDVNGDSRFNGTIDVKTAAPTNYNPDASDAPVKIWTEGIRNPFSLIWHSNGKLYAPVNESASGNAPDPTATGIQPNGGPVPPAYLYETDADGALPGKDAQGKDRDWNVDYFTQVEQNKYYGHPNPSRGHYILNGGNPTSAVTPFEVPNYPTGQQPDSNYRAPDMNLTPHRSANGTAEYTSDIFGANLKGYILSTEYSNGDDVIAIKLDANGKPISRAALASGSNPITFFNPLGVATNSAGQVFVGEFGRDPDGVNGKISVLIPDTTPPVDPGTTEPSGTPVLKVNFQAQTTVTPTGYSADFGQAFDSVRGYGWQSLSTGDPLSLVGNGRERGVASDKRLDTFMAMQLTAGSSGITTPGKWEGVVPNGTYDVVIGVGDPSFNDSRHVIRAEGNVVVDFSPGATSNRIVTVPVTVTDGRLTLDPTGGTNTKIDFVGVYAQSGTPPPTGDGSVVAKVNFQAQTTAAPAGYAPDFGQAFDEGRGYGWESISTGAPTSLVGSGRERGVTSIDKRLDTFVQMQAPTPGKWELVVPNGTYNVTVAVGDPSYYDSRHIIRAEGNVIVDFYASAGTPHRTVTVPVTVADGRLTIDPTGGTNTKINYVDVINPSGADTVPPTVSVTPSGVTDGSGNYDTSAQIAITATDAGTGIANNGIKYTLDGGAQQTYTGPFSVNTPGTHTVVATAVDNANNTSAPVTRTFTVVVNSGVYRVNFQTQTTSTPPTFQPDYGQAFDLSRGYGWQASADGTPTSFVGYGRERNVYTSTDCTQATNKCLDTFVMMQPPAGTSGPVNPLPNPIPGKWELVVPNGTYSVTVGVGDPSFYDSRHIVRAEGTSIVDFTPSAATPTRVVATNVVVADGRLTLDAVGGTNTKLAFVTAIAAGSIAGPTVTVTGSTDGTGSYQNNATVTITGGGTLSYLLNGRPLRNYTAPFAVSGAGNFKIEATSTVNGAQSSVTTKTFNVVQSNPTPASLQVTAAQDFLGIGNRLVFSSFKSSFRPGKNIALKNNGSSTINVTGFTFGGIQGGDFKLCDGQAGSPAQAASFSIAPGATAQVCVAFRPGLGGLGSGYTYVSQSSIRINSNDAAAPQYYVTLGGLNARDFEGANEPGMQDIVNALGYGTNVAQVDKPQALSLSPDSTAVGDEVVSAYWTRASSSQPVNLFPLAHYSGKSTSNSTSFGWYPKANQSTYNSLYNFPGGNATAGGAYANQGYGENQTLVPRTVTQHNGGTQNFTMNVGSAAFGFRDGQGNYSDDKKNGTISRWHNVRFFKVKGANGQFIPNTYIVGDDIGGPFNNAYKNWDYQDYAFLITNVQPDGANDQPNPAGVLSKTLNFTGNEGGMLNTGFASSMGSQNNADITLSGGRLNVRSTNDSNTSHTNMLRMPVNAGTDFRVESRLVGPFTAINAGTEQTAIWYGYDATHYLKPEVDWRPGENKRKITLWKQDGSTGNILAAIDLPANANTVDLRIDVTPATNNNTSGAVPAYARVYYSINGGAFVQLTVNQGPAQGNVPAGTASLPTTDWISSQSWAGIIQSHSGGGGAAQFTASYESFSVSRRY